MRVLVWLLCGLLAGPFYGFAITQVRYVGELSVAAPASIAVHEDGTLYVARHNGTISILNPAGATIATIGGKERAWKTVLDTPAGLAIDEDRLYVADTGLDRISVFNKTGAFLESYGRGGSGPKEFKNPEGVFVYRGVIYVADTGNDRIQMLGENGVFLGQMGGDDAADAARLDGPLDVAVDHRGRIYAVDRHGRIRVYGADGAYMAEIPEIEHVGELCPAIDGVYVSNIERMCVKKLSSAFAPVLTFGSRGEGRAQFLAISSLAVGPDGRIYAADPKRSLIHMFKPDAADMPLWQVSAPPPTSARWTDVIETGTEREMSRIVARDGVVYAVDGKSGDICRFEASAMAGVVAVEDMLPESLAFDAGGGMYVLADQKIYRLDQSGGIAYTFGLSDGTGSLSAKPDDMVIAGDGAVYVTDRRHHKVNVFNTDGVFIRTLTGGGDGTYEMGDPVAVAVDDAGHLYLLDAEERMVAVFSSTGDFINGFSLGDAVGHPVDLTVAGAIICVLDGEKNRVWIYTGSGMSVAGFGATGDAPGDMDTPVSIAALDKVALLVADPENHRLQTFAMVYTPDSPQNVVAKGGAREISVQWDRSRDAFVETYVVYRSRSGEAPVPIGRAHRCQYADTDVVPGVAYDYRIAAQATKGNESALSAPSAAVAQKWTVPSPENLQAKPKDFSVALSWAPVPSPHLSRYIVYRNDTEIARLETPAYFDNNVRPETGYVYKVSSLSHDNVISDAAAVTTRTLVTTRPPVDIEVAELRNIFSNTYKTYEKNGIGRIRVRNNTNEHIAKLTVQFTIKNFMDFASETVLRDMAPAESRALTLKAVFNDRILNVTEDTPVQTEITAAYYLGGERRAFSAKQSINVYEKHKMTWDDPARIAAFVTTKDAVVMDFTRGVLTQYDYTTDPLVSGCLLFNALGAAGVTYTKDPSNSYQETKDNTDLIDYLQYPRETLRRRSGDCDDLAILYAALLESVGIKTRFVEGPGHIFLMFQIDTAIMADTDTMNDMLVVADGQVWVPVEVTHVGKAFVDAWDAGSRRYSQWAEEGGVSTIDLHQSWRKYKPASLPVAAFTPAPVARADLEQRFPDGFDVIRKITIKIKHRSMVGSLAAEPDNGAALLQLGIIYAQYGILDEAMVLFQRALENDPANAALLNNMGNLHFLNGHYQKAADAYRKAVETDPADAFVWVNLAKALLKLKETAEAKQVFDKACTINPEVIRNHRSLALKLLGPA